MWQLTIRQVLCSIVIFAILTACLQRETGKVALASLFCCGSIVSWILMIVCRPRFLFQLPDTGWLVFLSAIAVTAIIWLIAVISVTQFVHLNSTGAGILPIAASPGLAFLVWLTLRLGRTEKT